MLKPSKAPETTEEVVEMHNEGQEEKKVDWHQIFAKPPPDERRRPKRQPISLAEAVSVRFVKPKDKEDDKEGREKDKNISSVHRPSSKSHQPSKSVDVRKMYNPATGAETEKKRVEKKRERPNELSKLKTAILEERAHHSLQLTPSSSQPILVTSEIISTATSSSKEASIVHIKTEKDARTVSLLKYGKEASTKPISSVPPSRDSIKGWKPLDIPRNFNPLFLHHIITPQYLTLVSSMLDKLVTYQVRAAANGNVGKRKKGIRFVSGLSHTIRSLSLRRSKMVIIAMDIEDSTSLQALVSTLWAEKLKIQLSSFNASPELLAAFNAISTSLGAQTGISSWTGHSSASLADVPFLFVPSRRLLAKYIHKRIPCSAISIVNVDGAHEEWKRLYEEVLPSLTSMASNMFMTQFLQASTLQSSQKHAPFRMNLLLEEVAAKQKRSKAKAVSPSQDTSYVSRLVHAFDGELSTLSDDLIRAIEKKKAGISKILSTATHRHFEAHLPKETDLNWSEEQAKRITAVRVMIEEAIEGLDKNTPLSPSLGSLTAEVFPLRINHYSNSDSDLLGDTAAHSIDGDIDSNFQAFPILPCYHQPFILKTKHDSSSFPTLWSPWCATKPRADEIRPNALLIVLTWFSSFIGCINKDIHLDSAASVDEMQLEMSKPLLSLSVLLHLPHSESPSPIDSTDLHLNLNQENQEESDEEGEEEAISDDEEIDENVAESTPPASNDALTFKINLEQSESTKLYLKRLSSDAKGLIQSSFASFFLLRASLPLYFQSLTLVPSSWAIAQSCPIGPPSTSKKGESTQSPIFDPEQEAIFFVQLAPPRNQPQKHSTPASSASSRVKDRFDFVPPIQQTPSLLNAQTHVIRMKRTDTIFNLIGKVAKAVQMAPKNVSLSLCNVPLSLLIHSQPLSTPSTSSNTSQDGLEQAKKVEIEKVDEGEGDSKKAFLSLSIESIPCLTHLSTLLASTREWK